MPTALVSSRPLTTHPAPAALGDQGAGPGAVADATGCPGGDGAPGSPPELAARVAELEQQLAAAEAVVARLHRAGTTHPVLFGGTHPTENQTRPLWHAHPVVREAAERFMAGVMDAVQAARRHPASDQGVPFTPEAWGLDRVCDAVVYATVDRCGVPVLVCPQCGADPLGDAMEQLHELDCPNGTVRLRDLDPDGIRLAFAATTRCDHTLE